MPRRVSTSSNSPPIVPKIASASRPSTRTAMATHSRGSTTPRARPSLRPFGRSRGTDGARNCPALRPRSIVHRARSSTPITVLVPDHQRRAPDRRVRPPTSWTSFSRIEGVARFRRRRARRRGRPGADEPLAFLEGQRPDVHHRTSHRCRRTGHDVSRDQVLAASWVKYDRPRLGLDLRDGGRCVGRRRLPVGTAGNRRRCHSPVIGPPTRPAEPRDRRSISATGPHVPIPGRRCRRSAESSARTMSSASASTWVARVRRHAIAIALPTSPTASPPIPSATTNSCPLALYISSLIFRNSPTYITAPDATAMPSD